MPATMTTVNAILKEVYEPSIREQINDEVIALRRIEKTSEGVSSTAGGKYVVFPVHLARNSGVGARLEGGTLPSAGNQAFAQVQVPLRYLYGRLQLTGQTIELADSNFQAFASAMSQEVNGLKDDVSKDLNRQIYGDGSGAICVIATGTTLNSFTVTGDAPGLQIGMQIGSGTIAAGVVTVVCFGATITQLSTTAGVTTVTATGGSGTAAPGHVVFRGQDTGTGTGLNSAQLVSGTANQKEWTGLKKIVAASGPLFNLDPATAGAGAWASRVDSNGGTPRALSEGLMLLNCDYVRKAGSRTSVMFTNLGVRRAYANLLVQQRRFTNTQEFDGGFSGLAFTTDRGDIPIVIDTDCPNGTIYGLNEKELKMYRETDWSFMNRDGSNFSRVPNVDAYESTLFQYSELGTHRRNAHFLLNDLIEG